MKTTIKDLVDMKNHYQETITKEGKRILGEAFKSFFAANPQVKRVWWSQYTPYFNDGDECVFSVHGDYPKLDLGTGYLEEEPYPHDHTQASYDAASDLINEVPKDVMKAVFGDHAEITASPEGFEVEQYDHD